MPQFDTESFRIPDLKRSKFRAWGAKTADMDFPAAQMLFEA